MKFFDRKKKRGNGDASIEKMKNEQPKPLPNLCIGTIGGYGAGKTTLTAAISKVLSERYNTEYKPVTVQELDNRPEEKILEGTIDTSLIEYRTAARHYTHIDCPGNPRFLKNTICGIQQMDAAILVVSTDDGITEEVVNCLKLTCHHTFIFINKFDSDDVEFDLLGSPEAEENLQEYKDEDLIICGSALAALKDPNGPDAQIILELMEMIENSVPVPERDTKGSFCMPVYKIYNIPQKGTVATGFIKNGSVRLGDSLEIIGYSDRVVKVTVKEIQHFHKDRKSACAGEYIGILLDGISAGELKRGQQLITPGSKGCCDFIFAEILMEKDFYYELKEFSVSAQYQCFFGVAETTGSIASVEERPWEKDDPDYVALASRMVSLQLWKSVPIQEKDSVLLLEHNKPVGFGAVRGLSSELSAEEEGPLEETVKEELYAPVTGKYTSLKDYPVQAFASGFFGPGCCIEPEEELVVAPCNGTILSVMGHDVRITTENGAELMILVGIDTVSMAGINFAAHVKEGQKVVCGQPLLTFSLEKIRDAGLPTATAFIVINAEDLGSVTFDVGKRVGKTTKIGQIDGYKAMKEF